MQMSKVQRSTKPIRHVVLGPSYFADEWANKPAGEVAIGLRLISQHDMDMARREAEREARGFYAEFRDRGKDCDDVVLEDVYNDAFLANVVARGTCDPNDTGKPYFHLADEAVRVALTPESLRRIWDELVILHKGSVAARPSASDEDVKHLGKLLPYAQLDDESRRLCAYLIEKIGPMTEVPDEEEAGYFAVAG